MTFAAPQFLIVLAVIPLLAVFARWFSTRRAAAVSRIGDPALVEGSAQPQVEECAWCGLSFGLVA